MFFKKKEQPAAPAPAPVPPAPAYSMPPMSAPAEPVAAPAMPSLSSMGAPAPAMAAPAAAQDQARKDPIKVFAQIVSILMRTPETKGLALADLEWLVMPAIRNQQTVVAEARDKDSGDSKGPIGMLIWASVSPDVDARLAADPSPVPRLAPAEWTSGDIPWVITAVGRGEVVSAMVEQVLRGPLAGRRIKVRSMNAGMMTVKEMGL